MPPKHIFTSLPYGELLWVTHNCSCEDSFGKYADHLNQTFSTWTYDLHNIQTALDKAEAQESTQILSKGNTTENFP